MKVHQLAFANSRDFCTIHYAAERIGVSHRTVRRLVADGTLKRMQPLLGQRETEYQHVILLVSEVEEYAAARKRVMARPAANAGRLAGAGSLP